MSLHPSFVIALIACLAWSTFFSMFNRFPLRGYRNIGFLAAYICLIVYFFTAPWKAVAITWVFFAVVGAVIYFAWELLQRLRFKGGPEKPSVHFPRPVRALLMWPVMIPEAVEYTLAELGVLKAPEKKESNQPLAPTRGTGP